MEGNVDSDSMLMFEIVEVSNTAAELSNLDVYWLDFALGDENYRLESEAILAADTWAELETAFQAAMAEEARTWRT